MWCECYLGSQNWVFSGWLRTSWHWISELLAPKRVDQLSGSIAGVTATVEALQGSGHCCSAEWALAKARLAPDLKPAQELATAARNILDQLSLQPPNMAASSNRNSGLEASTRSHLLPNELTTARNSPETNFLHNLPNMGMLLNHVCVQTFGPIPGFMLPWGDFWMCLQLQSMTAACGPFDQMRLICPDIYRASTRGDCAAKYGPDLCELRD